MEPDRTLADDRLGDSMSSMRIGPYLVRSRLGIFPGVDILSAEHEPTATPVILRRLLPMPALPVQEARRRLEAFQEETRVRESIHDPRHLVLFDFARNADGSAYQVFKLPPRVMGVTGRPRDFPVEDWVRIAAEAALAVDLLLKAGARSVAFDPLGVFLSQDQVRLCPRDFPWPPDANSEAAITRALAAWLYAMLAVSTPPGPHEAVRSLCESNPRVSTELDMTIRAAMNPYAVNAVSTPAEFARLLRDRDARPSTAGQVDAPVHSTSNVWANAGAWAVLLALGGVTLGWLLALYLPGR